MATRNREAGLATLETTHPPFPTLSSLQTENCTPKSSIIARFHQFTRAGNTIRRGETNTAKSSGWFGSILAFLSYTDQLK